MLNNDRYTIVQVIPSLITLSPPKTEIKILVFADQVVMRRKLASMFALRSDLREALRKRTLVVLHYGTPVEITVAGTQLDTIDVMVDAQDCEDSE